MHPRQELKLIVLGYAWSGEDGGDVIENLRRRRLDEKHIQVDKMMNGSCGAMLPDRIKSASIVLQEALLTGGRHDAGDPSLDCRNAPGAEI